MNFSQYTNKDIPEIFQELKTSEQGLTEKEAKERQKIYGFNEIKVKEVGLFQIFLRQLKSPFFYLLFISVFVSFLIGEETNALIIFIFLLINLTLGFSQESRAVKAAALLKKYVPLKARVKREGKEKLIDQRFLVPGDIVLLEAGNIAPADLRLMKVKNFLVNEESLTGESAPVNKITEKLPQVVNQIFQASNIVFMGTAVVNGEAEGVVINTGRQTFFGEVAKLTTESERQSIYEKDLLWFSKIILNLVVSSILIVFIVNLIIKGTTDFFDFLIFCIALIVSIIPEALPVVVTFALSQGALSLAKNKMVMKRLSAIEDLGNMEILCTDKTGTITENKLTVAEIFSDDKEKCLLYSLLCSALVVEEIESTGSSFDLALYQAASSDILEKLKKFKTLDEISFDNNRLRTSVLVKTPEDKNLLIIKGAPEVILKLCSQARFNEMMIGIKKEGENRRRVLGVAYKYLSKTNYTEADEKNLEFLGYISFFDPLKKTAQGAIQMAKKLNVQVKILTGDTAEVAGAVGKEIGLVADAREVILGEDLERLDLDELARACEKFHIFARLSPQTKLKIMETLQKKFEVGFLGEGINDAPSLKIANVALAVKTGADISREVADIILLRKDLKVIVQGIKKGRNIFVNINKYIKCTLASNFGNFYSMAIISFFISFLPMLPVQILLVNLLSDLPLIMIATDKVDIEELRKPKNYRLEQMIKLIILLAIVSSIFDFIFFSIFYRAGATILQTAWFIMSILTEIALIFSVRTRRFCLKTKRPSLALVLVSLSAIGLTISLPLTQFGQQFFQFAPLTIKGLLIIIILVFGYFVLSEIAKLLYFRHWLPRNQKQLLAK
ncbi:MAG: magnesium-translocating P-type ATPase [Minisyncoccales bacterium]